MNDASCNPRVLIVTPEVTYLPYRMGGLASFLTAKAGGLADVSASLISALFEQGADVHVAIPDYRAIFRDGLAPVLQEEFNKIHSKIPQDRIHLAEDRAFFYLNQVYSYYGAENIKLALAFQREVINNVVRRVQPDLIHCNDWMTGLIPAMSRQKGIPCLFTIHNVHTVKTTLGFVEDRGIDAAEFWQNLYYDQIAAHYEHVRDYNPVDLLTSGIFAAHFVNVVSPTFLHEIVNGRHEFIEDPIRRELTNKYYANCASGILNAPGPSFNPSSDEDLEKKYSSANVVSGKKENKRFLQKKLGLTADEQAPIFFWPSRLDPVQKGCHLLSDIFYGILSKYWEQNLQVVFVANGDYQMVFKNIVNFHGFHDRVAICDFDNALERQAYAASDFILMPSSFEPCGLPQMIAPIYGSLPVAHDTGGIHDTIEHLNIEQNTGNGFLFENFDSNGLFWAIEQAMQFYNLPKAQKNLQIKRIMKDSMAAFTHDNTARNYIELYEKMLQRPLIVNGVTKACSGNLENEPS
jgi:starch synthase/alpha-amylase